jgi:ABC-type uncharacterized transport system ATPase subunit
MSLITVSSLTKSFGAFDLFTDLSFSVPKGARLALVGPNGAGKSPEEFQKRLRYFIEMTEKNKMLGFGGIEKHY